MTPAIKFLEKLRIPFRLHEFDHTPGAASFGMEAAVSLGVPGEQVFKTLVAKVMGGNKPFAIALVPVSKKLSVKCLAQCLNAKKTEMADPKQAERVTGYLQGGISPLGQKTRLPTVIDISACRYGHIFVSAGRRGLEIEIPATELVRLTEAVCYQISV